ncbi:MAG TPA: Holliday junction resolvase RuvX [Gammaproteobacteria bacterium]|nr:Holliday junction resolvase RuvX [Gammaproteobacteria bacterium]
MTAPTTILAFDYGQRRIGVAIGQSVTATARALTTVQYQGGEPPWNRIRQLIADWKPQLLLVGLPLHADGRDSAFSGEARGFATSLRQHFDIPVELQDEYLSSAEAQSQLRAQRRNGMRNRRIAKGNIDAVAAALILESWFETNKTYPSNQP